MHHDDISAPRRSLLKGLAGASTLPFVGAFAALQAKEALAANGKTTLIPSPYGPIAPVKDLSTGLPLLQLPAGFSYKSFGWTGDAMSNGLPTPGGHDGMGVVVARKVGRSTELVLVRNHELGAGSSASLLSAHGVYDGGSPVGTTNKFRGGNTNLLFRDGNWVSTTPSLGGTATNCAGGVTPWGTWLSCEEVGSDAISSANNKHGYVFEVHADPAKTSGVPIKAMGRFAHEAAAVDPLTGYVYQSEDSGGKSGFYRFIPNVVPGYPGSLELGGKLQMAKVKGVNNANLATTPIDATYELEWVDIANPDADRGNATGLNGQLITNAAGPFVQGWVQGGLRMNRGEGMWYSEGKIYVMDTTGGLINRGSIWELTLATQVLRCIYSTENVVAGNMGDNLTVSPRHGILICEDASSAATDSFGFGQRLMGVTSQGDGYIFAKNNVVLSAEQLAAAGKQTSLADDHRDNEFAGACFDPTGRYLFVNIQTPGVTFAITGPWAKGPL
jgi:hypothetical protein